MQLLLLCMCCFVLYACNGATHTASKLQGTIDMDSINHTFTDTTAIATFGAGCFWCVEAVFQDLNGVYSVESGYMGGTKTDPSYQEVCSGNTGHAEVCRIIYDPRIITFKELLEVFWQTHDPTTLNMQGNDIGSQYRSAIFYYNKAQLMEAEFYKQQLDALKAFSSSIVTTLETASIFYKAEDYHQSYFNQNGDQSYCSYIIKPKVEKFKKVFAKKLKH